ncbi:MAG: hypothetical protein H7210_04340, partial [Pyrinomonadaceae bacterium]|nr:hypothetical protein [Phycisphaerales bacterium]
AVAAALALGLAGTGAALVWALQERDAARSAQRAAEEEQDWSHQMSGQLANPLQGAVPVNYQLLAFEMQELEVKGFTADSLVKHMKTVLEMDVTTDEVAIMLAFLAEQQYLEPVGRDGKKFKPAGAFLFDDAMVEYHKLRERGQRG